MREPVLQAMKILACRLNVIPSLNRNKIFAPCNGLMMLKDINALQTSLLSGLIKLYFTGQEIPVLYTMSRTLSALLIPPLS